jgi:alkylation response protein AidB-like acyl-CoA dehydrogenase
VTDDVANQAVFREEVRAWLKANLPKGWGTPEFKWPERQSIEMQTLGEEWTKQCYDAGYTGFGYPREYGGIERPQWQINIIREEFVRCGTPPGPMSQGPIMAGATILRWGQEWQKKRFLPRILSGEESWCQGFSEPDAGSDLANVRTTAVRDGDDWIVNGQKTWTSNWKFADFGLVVVRTDVNAPRHRNLSYFIFDCTAPGFSRRPLRQMTGESEFGEMFFDNMRIPHQNLLGELGRGWYVALTGLNAERNVGVGGRSTARRGRGGLDAIIDLAKRTRRYGRSAWDDPIFRQKIAQFAIEGEASRAYNARIADLYRKGKKVDANESSVSKNYNAESGQRLGDMTQELLGAYSQMVQGSPLAVNNGDLIHTLLRSRGFTIEQGTSEINRNIIAERILGLPRDKRGE